MPETETMVKGKSVSWKAKDALGGCKGCAHDDKELIDDPCISCFYDPKRPKYQARKLPGFDKCSICMKLDRPECGRPDCEEGGYKDFTPFPVIKVGSEITEQEKLDIHGADPVQCSACDYALDHFKCNDCGPEKKNFKEPPPSELFNPRIVILGGDQVITYQPTRDSYPKMRIFIPHNAEIGTDNTPIQVDLKGESQIKQLRDFLNACLETQAQLRW